MALCVMERFAEADPATVGENRTVTVTDCPGIKLNAPPPLIIENGERIGARGVGMETLPVNVAVEIASFVMVIIRSEDDPTLTFPKSREVGLTDMLMVAAPPDTFTVPVKK